MAAKKDASWDEPKADRKSDLPGGSEELPEEKQQDAEAADKAATDSAAREVPLDSPDPKRAYAAERERMAREDRLAQHQQKSREATGAPVELPETAAQQNQAELAEKK
jgi:hypothetical protein